MHEVTDDDPHDHGKEDVDSQPVSVIPHTLCLVTQYNTLRHMPSLGSGILRLCGSPHQGKSFKSLNEEIFIFPKPKQIP
jgi:hypothetical protein